MDAEEEAVGFGSVIIPAHNEAAVISRCLRQLLCDLGDGVQVVVVANGCSDATAELARAAGSGVEVVEIPEASKPLALRAGEAASRQMPRLYVDADVQLSGRSARTTLEALRSGAVAARPPILYDTEGASWSVRSYYRARSIMPSLHRHAWGAGVYGLSRAARARFEDFPEVTGDDLFIDRLLKPGELEIIDAEPVVVTTPRDGIRLLRILRRAQKSKDEESASDVTPEVTVKATLQDMWSGCRAQPRRAGDVAIYSWFALMSRLTRPAGRSGWERDESSRGISTEG